MQSAIIPTKNYCLTAFRAEAPIRAPPGDHHFRINAVRQVLSSGNALPMGALAACSQIRNERCGFKLPYSAASSLYPFRVARVSRLIGKFDSTAKPLGWQVNFRVIGQ
jgi:hypothetical protein